jgi:hypothetical protein
MVDTSPPQDSAKAQSGTLAAMIWHRWPGFGQRGRRFG